MKSASVAEIKKELKALPPAQLVEVCLKLAKYKKDNKELLTYLIFEAEDEQAYQNSIKDEINELFEEINYSNAYLAKKGLRKIVRILSRYIRYSDSAETEIEVLIHFCKKVKSSRIDSYRRSNQVIENMYRQQLKKIDKVLSTLHEDLQYDYAREIESFS